MGIKTPTWIGSRIAAGGAALGLFSVLALAGAATAPAHNGDVLAEYGAATVNGVIGQSEYGDGCVGPVDQSVNGTGYQITVCETNTEQNDYYGITVRDLTNDAGSGAGTIGDSALLWFDNDHSGTVTTAPPGCPYGQPDEDQIGWEFGTFVDGFYCKDPASFTGSVDFDFDGSASAKFTAGKGWVFEIKHPLDSGDPDDYSLQPHDTVGWCLTYDDKSNSPPNNPGFAFGELQYPAGCFVDFSTSTLGLVRGDSTLLGDVFKQNALDDALEAMKEKLKRYVAVCRFCPPDPRNKLLARVNEVIRWLKREREGRAIDALQDFKSAAKRFIRSGDLPANKRTRRFLKVANSSLRTLKKAKDHKSKPTTPVAGGLHTPGFRVAPTAGP